MDEALLLFRIIFAAFVAGHACQKLFGWFRGRGIAGTGAIFESSGLRNGALMATFAGLGELAAAGSIALGLLTPLGTSALIGAMFVAASTLWHKGFWAHLGGAEVPILYAFFALFVAWMGPGVYSVDAVLGLTALSGPWWALGGAAIACLGAAPLVLQVTKSRQTTAVS
jgi:putative oxidoreductase